MITKGLNKDNVVGEFTCTKHVKSIGGQCRITGISFDVLEIAATAFIDSNLIINDNVEIILTSLSKAKGYTKNYRSIAEDISNEIFELEHADDIEEFNNHMANIADDISAEVSDDTFDSENECTCKDFYLIDESLKKVSKAKCECTRNKFKDNMFKKVCRVIFGRFYD